MVKKKENKLTDRFLSALPSSVVMFTLYLSGKNQHIDQIDKRSFLREA